MLIEVSGFFLPYSAASSQLGERVIAGVAKDQIELLADGRVANQIMYGYEMREET